MMRRFLVALLAALLLPVVATAQQTQTIVVPFEEAAKIAIAGGDLDGAEKLLGEALRLNPKSTDALFLMAEVERRRGRLKEATEYYRKILADRPELGRVRLDLARALFELGEDFQAEYHFRLALAQPDLPEVVIQNINAFIYAIRQRKQYELRLDFGVSPDTNVTSGPATNEVLLFGLPFQLDEQARQKSGIGFVVSAYGEYLARLSEANNHRWRAGGSFFRSEYSGSSIDDMQLRLFTGPQLRDDRYDLSILGVVSKRWFGNEPYNEGFGPRIEGGWIAAPRWRIDANIEALRLLHRTQTFLDGYNIAGNTFTTFGIDQTSFVRFILGAGTERLESKGFSNYSIRVGVGYVTNLPFGITGFIQPEFYLVPYDEELPAFLDRRIDRIFSLQVSAYKRDWNFWGFSPTVNYAYTRNDSTVGFFGFDRHRFNIGLTREF